MHPLDVQLLKAVSEKNGAMAADILRPFRRKYSDSLLRYHLDSLESTDYIEQDRRSVKGRVFCKLTAAGERILAEAGQ